MKKFIIHIIIISQLIISSCGKEVLNVIPYVPINFNSSLNSPALLPLKSNGGAVILQNYGYAGLILYNNGEQIMAYDRCSTVNPEKKCALNLDNPTISVTDPCSGARFLLQDGSPGKAPAQRPLVRYNVNISGNNISVIN